VLKEFLYYNLVGIVNTIVGFNIIVLLMYCGVGAIQSNEVGYGTGAIISYLLNRKYTFNDTNCNIAKALKFFIVLSVAYTLNYFVLSYFLTQVSPYFAQIISAVTYTASAFILMKLFVFKRETKNNL